MPIYIYIYIYICVCVCVCECVNRLVYMHIHMNTYIYIYMYVHIHIYILGGACGRIIAVEENEHGDQSLNEAVCNFYSTDTIGKGIYPIIAYPAMVK